LPRIWITRSAPFGAQTAYKLKKAGYDVITAPLLRITLTDALISPADNTHLIFTSRHGVQALACQTDNRHWPVICVGDATAKFARSLGFMRVISVSGTATDIIDWVKANWPQSASITHMSGVHQRGDIIETLSVAGYSKAARIICYNSVTVASDPRLDARPDDYVLLYSPRGAAVLAELNLDMKEMRVISLSAAVDAALGDKLCKSRHIAEKPDEASLFAHLP